MSEQTAGGLWQTELGGKTKRTINNKGHGKRKGYGKHESRLINVHQLI